MIEETITEALNTVSALSGRVYPAKAPEDAGLPSSIYLQDTCESLRDLSGSSVGVARAVYQIYVLSESYLELLQVTAAVKAALEAITAAEVASVVVTEETPEAYEDNAGVLRAAATATILYYE